MRRMRKSLDSKVHITIDSMKTIRKRRRVEVNDTKKLYDVTIKMKSPHIDIVYALSTSESRSRLSKVFARHVRHC